MKHIKRFIRIKAVCFRDLVTNFLVNDVLVVEKNESMQKFITKQTLTTDAFNSYSFPKSTPTYFWKRH